MASCSTILLLLLLIIININLFIVSITAQQFSNITLGSFIVANADSTTPTWTSPSGKFAFGFKQVASGAYLLAIWFDQIPEKTVIWSANRNDLVPSGSRVRLSTDGTLELINQTGQQVWTAAKLAGSGTVAYAAMLDTGNLVLAGIGNTSALIAWQSFDSPTDTLLPGQVLNREGVLFSSFSSSNYSRGRFKLTLQTDGNLVLDTTRFPFNDINEPYWSTRTIDTGGFRLIFNQSGSIYLAQSNGTLLTSLYNSGALTAQFHQRLVLEYDGVLRHYTYPMSTNSSTSAAWSVRDFLPSNICIEIAEAEGGGACGFNSICSMGADGWPSCYCPEGYSSTGRHSGCLPEFVQHRCDQQSNDAHNFRLSVLRYTNWPEVEYAGFYNVDEEWCRESCLDDCFCAAAVFEDRKCYKKTLPFSNGRVDSAYNGKAFVKVRINNTISNIPNTGSGSGSDSSKNTLITTLAVLLACSVLLFLLSSFLLFVFYFKHRKEKMVQAHPQGVNTISRFNFNELHEATNGFKDELGRGAYSTVYKGTLKHNVDGFEKVVAVKQLDRTVKESNPEFQAEVSSISRTNHKNLVQLLGYCDEGQHRILVYEFMPNGSLADFLFHDTPRPNWYTRVQIAFAIARGLCYLHEECSTPIIHCDIKPQNVLLDESYTPKIADFGLAKLMRPDQTRTTTGIRGTKGYVAPEWFRNLPITVKVDVYSFGILLLELLCCRKNYVAEVEDEGGVVLADWAYDCCIQGKLNLLAAGDEEARGDMKMFERLTMTAIWCIQEDPTMRPHMKRVMHMIEGSIQVPVPPDPTTFIT